jgi:hypothetical protein
MHWPHIATVIIGPSLPLLVLVVLFLEKAGGKLKAVKISLIAFIIAAIVVLLHALIIQGAQG